MILLNVLINVYNFICENNAISLIRGIYLLVPVRELSDSCVTEVHKTDQSAVLFRMVECLFLLKKRKKKIEKRSVFS